MEMDPINFKKDHEYEITCPVCGGNYQHSLPDAIKVKDGQDDYKAERNVRGDVISIPFHGECGHVWELCLGFHKGNTLVFVKTEDVYVSRRVSLR